MQIRILFSLFFAPALCGQNLSLGLIGGAGLTDAANDRILAGEWFQTRIASPSKDWIAGASLELRLRSHLSVEIDGMFRELHIAWAGVEPDGSLNSVSPSPVVTWEFPILAKYRFHWGRTSPFIEAGPSFRTTGNLNAHPSHRGATAGLGLETRLAGLSIAPAIRYTHWAADLVPGDARTKQNQVELLVGFSRAAESNGRPLGRRISVGALAGWGLNRDLPPSTTSGQTPVYTPLPDGSYTYTLVGVTYRSAGLTNAIAGPTVEAQLTSRLSVEVDALHKSFRTRTQMTFDDGHPPQTYTDPGPATWQFPVLAKYRFPWGKFAPFVEAGPSFRIPNTHLSTHGATAGAGVQFAWRALLVSPALRFTHWADGNPPGWSAVTRNEASVVIGFSFGGTRVTRFRNYLTPNSR